jgi:hypothetical protein
MTEIFMSGLCSQGAFMSLHAKHRLKGLSHEISSLAPTKLFLKNKVDFVSNFRVLTMVAFPRSESRLIGAAAALFVRTKTMLPLNRLLRLK